MSGVTRGFKRIIALICIVLLVLIFMGFRNCLLFEARTREINTKEKFDLVINQIKIWNPEKTAVVICDMWENYPCLRAKEEINKLAPKVNEFADLMRKKGCVIIHAPDGDVSLYARDKARQNLECLMERDFMKETFYENFISHIFQFVSFSAEKFLTNKSKEYFDVFFQKNSCSEGCGCNPPCQSPLNFDFGREHSAIKIDDNDFVVMDKFEEIYQLVRKKNIENILICGVHLNVCIVSRYYGVLNLLKLGCDVVIVRDLVDSLGRNAEIVKTQELFNSLVIRYAEDYGLKTTEFGFAKTKY